MEEKLVFNKKTQVLKTSIDFKKYKNLYDQIDTVLLYAVNNLNELESVMSRILSAFNCSDVPWDFKIQYTMRTYEVYIEGFVSANTEFAIKNNSIQKNGQIIIEKLNNHIESCIERQVPFHSENFDTACHLLIILEKLLPVLQDRILRSKMVIDEIRDVALNDLRVKDKNGYIDDGHYLNELLRKELAEYYYHINDYAEALRQYTSLVEQAAQNLVAEWYPPFVFCIADCQIGLGQEKEALQTIIESGRIAGYLYIGDYYLKSGKTDEALKSYRQAIDSGLPAGYLSIGDYYRSIGQTDEAIQSYQKAIDAGNINGHDRIIDYYKSIGMMEEAKTWKKKREESKKP